MKTHIVVENSEEQSGIQSWINNGRITGSVDEQRTICENNLPSQDEGVAGTELGHQTLQPLTLQMLEDHPEYLPHALFIGTECYMYEGPPIIVPVSMP